MGSAWNLGGRRASFAPYGPADPGFRARLADVLTRHDDALLAAYVEDETALSYRRLRHTLAAQTGQALAHPVFFGSAVTGAGVDALAAGIAELLPAAASDPNGPVSGVVFKVERGPAAERIAYVRMFSGTARVRDAVPFRGGTPRKITAIRVVGDGSAAASRCVAAGQIAKVWGLGDIKIWNTIGMPPMACGTRHFPPPALESAVVPRRPGEKGALHAALTQLAEQDPLINLRQDDARSEIHVSLYGEVQRDTSPSPARRRSGLVPTSTRSTARSTCCGSPRA